VASATLVGDLSNALDLCDSLAWQEPPRPRLSRYAACLARLYVRATNVGPYVNRLRPRRIRYRFGHRCRSGRASDRDWVRREGEGFYGDYYSIPSMSVT
jgi:hypothetical protein